jgi:hypothetical protein
MNSPRRQHAETIDYLLVGLSPALIICMICSLVFYLLTVLYDGPFTIRLMYLLGLYSGAMVLVARIAIEQSRAYALGYMLALGGATLLVVPPFFFNGRPDPLTYALLVGLLVLIGWLADRITFDCTLIDDRQDASGQGLLQSLGWVGSDPEGHSSQRRLGPQPTEQAGGAGSGTGQRLPGRPPSRERRRKRHNPGVWILYFALLAIPLFGVAQLLIPVDQPERLARCRWLLSSYLLSTFGLLTITSFLGLRRYLRQRRASMPADIAAGWLTSGFVLVLILLLVGWLLPLPSRLVERAEQLGMRGDSAESLTASRWGWGRESARPGQEPGDAQVVGEPSRDASSKPSGNTSSEDSGRAKGADNQGTNRNDAAGGRQSERPESRQDAGGEPSGARGERGDATAGESQRPEAERGESSSSESGSRESGSRESGSRESGGRESGGRESGGRESERAEGGRGGSDRAGGDNQAEGAEAADGAQRTDQGSAGNGDSRSADDAQSAQDRGTGSSAASPRSPPQLPNVPPLGRWLASLRWLLVFAIAIALIVLAVVQRRELWAAITELWRWWQGLWANPTSPQPTTAATNTAPVPRAESIPFSSFRNPFAGGAIARPPAEIVRYTFAAAEAWGAERMQARHPEETPEEYLERLKSNLPHAPWPLLGQLYNQVAYANQRPRAEQVQPLAKLWQQMR